ncbi:hypothetical protein [Cyanobacterium aponinum]|uniref:Uncharacterized protein n=1 Tax=Cyanobacterium aponinum (strain PCC 10605) TaxID=755178 RepID=K9Z8R1_CYAAP|nr:hypothetical protein [Cyanobacterium aponinum]AFZ55581.1 hypothetical protein Cyan10605_3548 [Cyanobacterium aponinum PCC 10605]
MITTNNREETLRLLNLSCAELMEKPNRIYRIAQGQLFLTEGNMTVSINLFDPIEVRHLEKLDTLMINALDIYSRL